MRILYFVNGLNYKGGIARIVVDKANYLADIFQYEVNICVLNGELNSAYELSENVHLVSLSKNRSSFLFDSIFRKFLAIIPLIHKTRNCIKAIRPDIVVNSQAVVLTWILPFIVKNVPKVMEIHLSKNGIIHNIKDKNRLFQWLYMKCIEWFYSQYNRFVILTEEDRSNWHCPNIEVIGNFTRLTDQKLSPLNSNKIICVARYHFHKRLDLLISSWKLIAEKYPKWEIHVYGMGPDKYQLEQKIKEVGLSGSLYLHPATDKVEDKYLDSSIFVLTSEHEGFALVLLEAMQMGLPICAMDVVGVRGIVENGRSGLLAPFGNVQVFADNLGILIESPELRMKLREEGLNEIKKYDVIKTMEKWNNLFLRLIVEKK